VVGAVCGPCVPLGAEGEPRGRVGAALAGCASHRSGRAQLTHPVRQRTGWQRGRDTSAEAGRAPLRLSRGVTVTGLRATTCSPWFPPRGPSVGSALPSPGSSGASSPASRVLRRCATPWAPLAALRCLRLAIPCAAPVGSLPAVQDAQPRAWGSASGPHLRKRCAGRPAGPPRFPDNPLSLCPVLRPRQDRTRQALAACRHGPRYVHNEGSHDPYHLSGLNRTASGLAVYASSGAVTRTRRKTRFRPLARRYRTGLVTRRVVTKGF
jgi:hypothetical protein